MTTVVISQPMLFPWVGMLEQIRLADVFVHYDDVQFSKGWFTNRVQVKSAAGTKWLTVPLKDRKLGRAIRDSEVDDRQDWRSRHLAFLEQALKGAPAAADALALAREVYAMPANSIADVAIPSMELPAAYLGLVPPSGWLRSSAMGVPGSGWPRVLEIVRSLGGDRYVTGHGGRNYLDHEAFERAGVRVEYMRYEKRPYPQMHGAFTPFVSALDLVANLGREGGRVVASGTVPWREFVSAEGIS